MTTSTISSTPVLFQLLGIDSASPLAGLIERRPTISQEIEDYYQSLFNPEPSSAEALPLTTRLLVAIRVATFTGSAGSVEYYTGLARANGVPEERIVEAADQAAVPSDPQVAAVLHHANLLTTEPRDATQADIAALKSAGLTPAGIVALSQTIAFITYQVRLVAGLRALGSTVA